MKTNYYTELNRIVTEASKRIDVEVKLSLTPRERRQVSPIGKQCYPGIFHAQDESGKCLICNSPVEIDDLDTKRLDWLEDQCKNKGTEFAYNREYGRAWVGFANGDIRQGFTIREAIDAAMCEGKDA